MIQTIVVIVIVALAAIFIARRYWKQLGGKNGEASCGCGGCSGGGCQGDANQSNRLTSLDSLQNKKEV